MLIVAEQTDILMISGNGDVIEPDNHIAAIGSGSMYAQAAASALIKHAPGLSAREIVEESLQIAADICIYTNDRIIIESFD
jgi:ATP-dependent HslUV protease subunit HslV